ncbi:hypothetical protein [Nonomuraea recticatena]|uniref:hypothetical protein n=1 Tax=Nonomuraea recticatena TaxID=46178 RepID=UPI0036110441
MELLERIGSIVVPIAVALYALLYIGIEQMYAVFGVNPQQVGVDQAVLLGRMTSTLVLLLLVGIPLLGVFVGLGWLADRMTRVRRPGSSAGSGSCLGSPQRWRHCGAGLRTGGSSTSSAIWTCSSWSSSRWGSACWPS